MSPMFRLDNTEGYSEDELEVLNDAFDIVWSEEDIPTEAADEDTVSDTRQFVGERIESYYVDGMTAFELVAAYYGRRSWRTALALALAGPHRQPRRRCREREEVGSKALHRAVRSPVPGPQIQAAGQ